MYNDGERHAPCGTPDKSGNVGPVCCFILMAAVRSSTKLHSMRCSGVGRGRCRILYMRLGRISDLYNLVLFRGERCWNLLSLCSLAKQSFLFLSFCGVYP